MKHLYLPNMCDVIFFTTFAVAKEYITDLNNDDRIRILKQDNLRGQLRCNAPNAG
jgi:hypothetical protein